MLRTAPQLVLLLFGLAACGGGGGGGGGTGGPPQGGAVIAIGNGTLTAGGGQVLAIEVQSALLTPGTDYDVQWTANGVAAGTGKARAVAASALSLLAPLVPTGTYQADVSLAGATGRLRVDVAEAVVVPTPITFLASVRAQLGAAVTTLRADANADPEATRRATRLADLDRIDQWISAHDTARASASPADLQLLSTILEANPILRDAGTGGGAAFDEEQRLLSVAHDIDRAEAAARLGVAAAGLGRTGQPTLTVSTGLVAYGLVAVAAALPRTHSAVARPWKPADALVLEIASAATGSPPQPVLQVQEGTPVALVGSANFGSLAEADRTSVSTVVQAIFADLDALQALFTALAPSVTELVASQPATAPATRVVERDTIDIAAVSIEVQTNPAVLLTFAGGQLSVSLFGGSPPADTTAFFRYEAGEYGSLNGAVDVQVVAPAAGR